jgi:hypothetical protein
MTMQKQIEFFKGNSIPFQLRAALLYFLNRLISCADGFQTSNGQSLGMISSAAFPSQIFRHADIIINRVTGCVHRVCILLARFNSRPGIALAVLVWNNHIVNPVYTKLRS